MALFFYFIYILSHISSTMQVSMLPLLTEILYPHKFNIASLCKNKWKNKNLAGFCQIKEYVKDELI